MKKEHHPRRRNKLRAALIAEGYENMSAPAALVGISPGTLYGYTSGWKSPGRQTVKALAKLLNLSVREMQELL